MIRFSAPILKFTKKGEKTGWTYIEIPAHLAEELNPGVKKSFRVKGKLDHFAYAALSLLPMGAGDFILPINAALRKGVGKKNGAMLQVEMELDKSVYKINAEFISCLKDEPEAFKRFSAMPDSHQRYYSKWIESAKTDATKIKRISLAVNSFLLNQSYADMLRSQKNFL
jgi:hypothetical protein